MSDKDTATGTIKNDDGALSAVSNDDAIKADEVKLSPNPAKSVLTVTGLPSTSDINITDLHGKVLIRQRISNKTGTIDIANLAPGVYMFKYVNGQMNKVIKFIKE